MDGLFLVSRVVENGIDGAVKGGDQGFNLGAKRFPGGRVSMDDGEHDKNGTQSDYDCESIK